MWQLLWQNTTFSLHKSHMHRKHGCLKVNCANCEYIANESVSLNNHKSLKHEGKHSNPASDSNYCTKCNGPCNSLRFIYKHVRFKFDCSKCEFQNDTKKTWRSTLKLLSGTIHSPLVVSILPVLWSWAYWYNLGCVNVISQHFTLKKEENLLEMSIFVSLQPPALLSLTPVSFLLVLALALGVSNTRIHISRQNKRTTSDIYSMVENWLFQGV